MVPPNEIGNIVPKKTEEPSYPEVNPKVNQVTYHAATTLFPRTSLTRLLLTSLYNAQERSDMRQNLGHTQKADARMAAWRNRGGHDNTKTRTSCNIFVTVS
jgi:hypothetical protein